MIMRWGAPQWRVMIMWSADLQVRS